MAGGKKSEGAVMNNHVGVGLGIVVAPPKHVAYHHIDEEEEYSNSNSYSRIVRRRRRHLLNSSYTKLVVAVYDHVRSLTPATAGNNNSNNNNNTKKKKEEEDEEELYCVFDISPVDNILQPPHDHYFLSCCHHCKTELAGKDVYMYRGERAFCSIDCRCMEIEEEEEGEKRPPQQEYCRSQAVAAACDVLYTGIFAI